MVTPLLQPELPHRFPFGRDNLKNILVRPFTFGMWVYMGNAMNAVFFVTLTFNFKVTGGLLKVRFWPFFTFWPVLIYRKLDHPMGGIYNTYICPVSMQKFDLKALH